jgi:hypothetical protein
MKQLVESHNNYYDLTVKPEAYTLVFCITDEVLRIGSPVTELARDIEDCIEEETGCEVLSTVI